MESSRPTSAATDFDITSHYTTLLHTHPQTPAPIHAISALLTLLTQHPTTTVSETLSLLSSQTIQLLSTIPNPLPARAGTDLLTRFLVSALNPDRRPPARWEELRASLLKDPGASVRKAEAAMRRIAGRAGELCGEGDCVLIYGECGVVRAMLGVAAGENGPMGASGARLSRPRFRVVYLQRGSDGPEAGKRSPTVTMLRRLGVPVAVIGFEALGEVLRECSHVLLGAEVVTATGGIVGRFGTKVVVELATLYRKDVYVLAESFRFVRVTPVGLGDLGLEQRVLDFRVDEDGEDDGEEAGGKGKGKGKGRGKGKGMEKMGMGVDTKQGQRNGVEEILVDNRQIPEADWVDFTPAKYIKAIVTELQGPKDLMPPSGVFEQLMKIWMY